LWWLAAHPHSIVLTTAPTQEQVRQVLWREIAKAYSTETVRSFLDGELTDTKLELAADWYALGVSTDRPERLQGWHNEKLLVIVDEAAGVPEPLYEAAEGWLTSENSRLLLIGNPNSQAGTFFDAWHRNRAQYHTIAISAFDTPLFTGEQVTPAVQFFHCGGIVAPAGATATTATMTGTRLVERRMARAYAG
jgi:hypothetical protein